MQIRRDIMTEQGKETRDRKSLIAIPEDLEIDGLLVEQVRKETDDGVDGDHQEDTDDVALLPGTGVVGGVHEDEEGGGEEGEGGEDEGEEGAQPHDASGPGRPIVARGRLMRGC